LTNEIFPDRRGVARDTPAVAATRYADLVMSWLQELGYTHCFYVGGQNVMHLLAGARERFQCVPFVHESGAGFAAAYFNEAEGHGRAFALVNSGAGLTNVVSAISGAYLESRELLIIGGQVRSSELAEGALRHRGIGEIHGASIVEPITLISRRIESPISHEEFAGLAETSRTARKGPVFIEFCADAQAAPIDAVPSERLHAVALAVPDEVDVSFIRAAIERADEIAAMIEAAERPVFLIGGGVSRRTSRSIFSALLLAGIPVQTTWNGADRVPSDAPIYFGRPNAMGQRYANVILQQADLVVAFGTRLGLQQTGSTWENFVPLGKVVQVDIDAAETEKGHPRVDIALRCDANTLLRELLSRSYKDFGDWRRFCEHVKETLPLVEDSNFGHRGYVDPYAFFQALSEVTSRADIIVPGSGGTTYGVAMQAYNQRGGQIVLADKAAMGYAIAGAAGAAMAWPERRTIAIENDASFLQNVQELGTLAVNGLNVKLFVFSTEGRASASTGLGVPNWIGLFEAYGIPASTLHVDSLKTQSFAHAFEEPGVHAFIVPIHPRQTFHPMHHSRVNASGEVESQPLHVMHPELAQTVASDVLRYLVAERADSLAS
jgi:acetolactate synthase-1/2/3 large subunit